MKLLIALLLGGVTVLGFAPFYLSLLPLLTFTLLCLLWKRAHSAKQAALIGFVFGLGLFGAGVTWLYVSLHDFGHMPPFLAVLTLIILCVYLAFFPALTGWVASLGTSRTSRFWPAYAAALWVLTEWLRGTLFTGFPWLAIGYTQIPNSLLTGFAPITGVYGISLLLFLTSAGIARWLETWRNWRIGLWLGSIWIVGLGLQQIQWTEPDGDPVTVSLLQGNIEQDLKWRPDHLIQSLQTYADLIQHSSSQLIVAPEIALPLFYEEVPPDYLAMLTEHARRNQSDLLIGIAERSLSGSRYFNSMFSFGVSPEQSYRKHHLVPFGEYLPLKSVLGWIPEILQIPLSDFSRGSLNQKPMELAGQRVAINICYEDVFGEEIILQLPQANLLINASNDAWFGRSIGPYQHLQIAQMRALETGRYMLRATNTGVTAIINERGQVLQQLEMFVTDGLHGIAQGFSGATPYVRYGNSLVLGIIVILLAASWMTFSGDRKRL